MKDVVFSIFHSLALKQSSTCRHIVSLNPLTPSILFVPYVLYIPALIEYSTLLFLLSIRLISLYPCPS